MGRPMTNHHSQFVTFTLETIRNALREYFGPLMAIYRWVRAAVCVPMLVESISSRLDTMSSQVDNLQERLDRLTNSLRALDAGIEDIEDGPPNQSARRTERKTDINADIRDNTAATKVPRAALPAKSADPELRLIAEQKLAQRHPDAIIPLIEVLQNPEVDDVTRMNAADELARYVLSPETVHFSWEILRAFDNVTIDERTSQVLLDAVRSDRYQMHACWASLDENIERKLPEAPPSTDSKMRRAIVAAICERF